MKKYLEKVLHLVKKFKEANFIQIPREENVEADTLAKEASATGAMDEFDEVQYIPKYRSPGSAANREQRKLDDPNSIILERQKAFGREG